MKILVTGGAGYIGSVVVQMLLGEGHDAVVFDNLERGHRDAVDGRARLVEGDLRDRDCIRDVLRRERPEAVMHFAAYALVSESMRYPERYFRNNLSGGLNLLEALLETEARRVVFSSTCATYGEPPSVPITEEMRQRPTNAYGESKLAFERVLHWMERQRGMQPVSLRYFNACGATEACGEDHDPETHLIPLVLRVAQGAMDKVKIYGDDYETPDGTCLRDFIHIVDLARAHILALHSDCVGAYNLGTGRPHSVREVVELAREVTGVPIPAEIAPRRAGDPARLYASAEKAKRDLGWTPEHTDLRSILESAWRWRQAHPGGYAA